MELFFTLCFGSLACVVLAVLVAIGQRRFERWWFRRTQPRDWHDRTGTLMITRAGQPTYLYTGDRHNLDLSDVVTVKEVDE